VAELVAAAGLGHGAERRAAEVEVILGHGVVVHVSDDHRLRVAGAGIVVLASYLEKKESKTELVSRKSKLCFSLQLFVSIKAGTKLKDLCLTNQSSYVGVYLVAGAAALAVLEQGLVAARCHCRERRQVHVLESTGATCMQNGGGAL